MLYGAQRALIKITFFIFFHRFECFRMSLNDASGFQHHLIHEFNETIEPQTFKKTKGRLKINIEV